MKLFSIIAGIILIVVSIISAIYFIGFKTPKGQNFSKKAILRYCLLISFILIGGILLLFVGIKI